MTLEEPEEKQFHLDSVLQQLGFGRHQLATLAMVALVYTTNPMYNVNYVFAVEDVGYRCKIQDCESTFNFSVPWLDSSSSEELPPDRVRQCRRYPTTGTCSFDNRTEVECTEWVYEVPDSFVAEFDLGCQDWKQSLVGTVHALGNMIGLLFQGQLSDRFGRKTAAVFAGTMGSVMGLAKSFAGSYWMYVILEGLEAFTGDALSPMFMLNIEVVEKKKAIHLQMILLNCYTCGLIIMPFIAWAFPYWRHFLRVLYAPTLLIIFYYFCLDESIRWLFSKGKRDKAIKLIEKIARRNGKKLDKAMLESLEYAGQEESSVKDDKKLLLKTIKSKIMLQRFLICMVWWFTVTLINYGMMIGAVFIEGNKYMNFALLMMMDIPANMFYWVAMSKYKRKLPLFWSFIVGGIFCVSQPFVPKGYAWMGLVLFMAFETLATFSFNIVYMYTSELFPTYTRNSIHSLCSSVGRLGSLVAPQTPLLIAFWSGLPSLIFGVTSLLCGALTLLIPETANTELPDTVEEAERIGRKKSVHDAAEKMPLRQQDAGVEKIEE